MHFSNLVLSSAVCLAVAQAQIPTVKPFNTAFNSTFSLSSDQIRAASLDSTRTSNINTILNFSRSRLANGGPRQDDFYTLPPRPKDRLQPGHVLKVQAVTDPGPYTLASGSSLSRILYTTRDFNGTVIPASAYILWPYLPRQFGPSSKGKTSAVLWAHGTSGYFADAAPSAYRNLQYETFMPLALAEAGYAVVAPDYAGLGVGKDWDNNTIPHQYAAAPAGAQDLLYAMQAAQAAFGDRLTGKFAIAGHSQGGSISWASTELLAKEDRRHEFKDLVSNYVGAISMAPPVKFLNGPLFALTTIAFRLPSIFPDFRLEQWLQPLALARLRLLEQTQGDAALGPDLFLSAPIDEIVKPDWYNSSYHGLAFETLSKIGSRPFLGPLLVVQGAQDPVVSEAETAAAVTETCDMKTRSDLEYVRVEGFGHTPIIAATRSIWQQWLEDRFNGKPASRGCKTRTVSGWLGKEAHFVGSNGFYQWAGAPEYAYQNAASF